MKKQLGLSFVELMVGIAIGIFIVGAAGSLFVSTLRSNIDAMKQQRFEQSVWVLLDTMAANLRRAGFANSTTDLLNIEGWGTGVFYKIDGSCILFTYVDTTLTSPKQQYFGYKLDTTSGIMYSYQGDSIISCTGTSSWLALTDLTQIKISKPTSVDVFSAPTYSNLLEIRFKAEGVGFKSGSTSVQREFTKKVYLRNS